MLSANRAVNDTLYFTSATSDIIPNIQAGLVNKGTVRQYVTDSDPCPEPSYDLGIMGLAASTTNDLAAPNIKTNLLRQGRISNSQASMYFSPSTTTSPELYSSAPCPPETPTHAH